MCDAPWGLSNPDCREKWKEWCSDDPIHSHGGRCLHFINQELDADRDTMDEAVRKYCSTRASIPECACLMPPASIKKNMNKATRSLGHFSCWYSACQNPNAFKTTTIVRDQEHCTSSCIFDPDDFQKGIPVCNIDFQDDMFQPWNYQRVRDQTSWLTQPMKVFAK